MAYTSRTNDSEKRYESLPENPTISSLVQPSNERQNLDNPYTTRDRYTSDSRRTGETTYESTKRTGDNQYTGTDQGNKNSDYTRRVVPTADVYVDPYRRPSHGNARTCVMEVNISVGLGGDRVPQASVTTNNYSSKPPVIRSTAFLEDVRYVDLTFQSPDNTAQLRTDGIIRQSLPRNSNKNIDE